MLQALDASKRLLETLKLLQEQLERAEALSYSVVVLLHFLLTTLFSLAFPCTFLIAVTGPQIAVPLALLVLLLMVPFSLLGRRLALLRKRSQEAVHVDQRQQSH